MNRGAIGKAKLREIKKPSTSLKLKNNAIGRKPTAANKMSEKKLTAILQNTDILTNTVNDMDKDEASSTVDVPEAKPEEIKENLTESVARTASKIKVPTVYSKDTRTKPLNVSAGAISLNGLKNRSIPTAKTKNAPIKSATTLGAPQISAKNGDPPKPSNSYKMVKGVRMNRRFELMMLHRNKTDKN